MQSWTWQLMRSKKGAFDFIVKPFKADYLVHAIEKAVKYNNLLR